MWVEYVTDGRGRWLVKQPKQDIKVNDSEGGVNNGHEARRVYDAGSAS